MSTAKEANFDGSAIICPWKRNYFGCQQFGHKY